MNMEKKIYGIVLLLLFLLAHEVMIEAEARSCYSRSRHYNGRCFFRSQVNNCRTICREERFTTGKCARGTCYCAKQCSIPGGGHHPPPPPPPEESGGGGGDGGEGGGSGGGGGGEEGSEA